MKSWGTDLEDNIPYIDRTTADDEVLGENGRFFRKNGYWEMKGLIPAFIIEAYRKNPALIEDIANYRKLLEELKDLMGDEMIHRKNLTPDVFNPWTITAMVALDPTHSLQYLPTTHNGTEIGNATARKWDAQKGDVLVLHTATHWKEDQGILGKTKTLVLPLYYVATSALEDQGYKRVIRKGWNALA